MDLLQWIVMSAGAVAGGAIGLAIVWLMLGGWRA